jgi:Ser/Thr protein kinase RdoA (MazF antagonist)
MGMRIPGQPSLPIEIELQQAALTIAPPVLSQAHASQNAHYRGADADGQLFIKVYRDHQRFETEGAVIRTLRTGLESLIEPKREGLLSSTGLWWRAFPFVELQPVDFSDVAALRSAAKMLGRIHRLPRASLPHLVRKPHPHQLIAVRIDRLHPWPDLLTQARRLQSLARDRLGPASDDHDVCLVLGDFGQRNTFRRPDRRLVLIDFEDGGIGSGLWDLAKIWDAELAAPELRAIFLDSYADARGPIWDISTSDLWWTRFAAALAIFTYAARTQEDDFFAHGREKLRSLGDELSLPQ